jgi:putative sugar O-methyltransferase
MQPISNLSKLAALALSAFGAVLNRLKWYSLSNTFYNAALFIRPKFLHAHIRIAYAFVEQGNMQKAAEKYREIVALQPTLSIVYSLGLDLARRGNINDDFYKSILDAIETPEIITMIRMLADSPALYQPSKLWLYFMVFNTLQLETGGIDNFKRTVNHNYFNWTADVDIHTQYQALKNDLTWSDLDLSAAQRAAHFDSDAKPTEFSEKKWNIYVQFLCMLWEYSLKHDQLRLLDKIDEPQVGNPVGIKYKGRLVTQDICNTVLEINTMMQYINHSPGKRLRVMELGAGHGRIGNVLLHTVPNSQIVIVDIPPALYVSQWYLTTLSPKHRAFKFREFSDYNDIQKEFEESSLAFLSPAQVEHLPAKCIDLFINICSLQEMTHAQIDMWFDHIDRLCKGWFYTKQYIVSKNTFDHIVIRREDYPVKADWQTLFNRINPIFPELFEAIYKMHY